MIVLVDLDGTLVDRAAAFAGWARRFAAEHGGGDDDVRWLLDADADGYAPRADVAAALRQRLGLDDDVPRLVERLLFEHVEDVRPFPGVLEELDLLRSAERSRALVVVVTNGTVAQQERKISVSGLVGHGLLTGRVSAGRTWPGGPPPGLEAVGAAELLAAVQRTA